VAHTQIVQTRRRFHEIIRARGPRVAQGILDAPGTLDATNRMFDSDPHTGQGPIVAFLGRRQLFAPRLFFG